jgi:uncharacterized protein (DUF1800 family)
LADKSISYEPIHQQLVIINCLLSDVERAEEKRLFDQDKVSGYVNNWLAEFRDSKNPIREWATLFWHEHLPCAGRGQSNTFVLEQNYLNWELYRKNALDILRQLLVEYYQNLASMYFLDIHRSYKEGPSQNFSRELLELYTLGAGNYSEKDVQEVARCFTGLHFEKEDAYVQQAFRVEDQFDSGVKEILGKSGNFYPNDVIDIILEKRECADFIARKAVFFFLGEGVSEGFPRECGKVYYESNYDFSRLLDFMWNHPEAENSKLKRVKSPIEHLVFLQRDLGLKTVGHKTNGWILRKWGQYPLSPWSVKGWPQGEAWLQGEYLVHRTHIPCVLLKLANRKDARDSGAYKVKSRLLYSHLKDLRYFLDAEWDEEAFYQKLSDLGMTPNQYLLGDEKSNNLSLEECLVHPNYQYINPVAQKRLFTA